MSTEPSTPPPAALLVIVPDTEAITKETGASAEKSVALFAPFQKSFDAASLLLAEEAKATTADDARKLRLKLVKARTGIEAVKKSAKADILIAGKVIDWYFNKANTKIEEAESRLDAIEKAEAIAEAERKAKLKTEREAALKPFGVNPEFYMLDSMPADNFAELLNSSRIAHEAKLAEAKRIEDERIAKDKQDAADKLAREQADAAERKRIEDENDRLKREKDEREKADQIERDRIAAEKVKQQEEEAKALVAKKELHKNRAETLAPYASAGTEFFGDTGLADLSESDFATYLQKLKTAKEEADAKAEKERADAEKAAEALKKANAAAAKARKEAADLKAEQEKRDEEARAEKKRLDDQKKAEDDAKLAQIEDDRVAAAKAAAAPEREKLIAFAMAVRALQVPELSTDAGKAVATIVKTYQEKLAVFVEDKAAAL